MIAPFLQTMTKHNSSELFNYKFFDRIKMQQCIKEMISETSEIDRTEKIGEGTYGVVYAGIYKERGTEYRACIKELLLIDDSQQMQKIMENEIDLCQKLKQIGCDNLVQVYEVIQTNTRKAYIVMERCEQVMERYLEDNPQRVFSDREIQNFALDFLNGYKELQQRNIIHRDISFKNVFMKGGKYKVEMQPKIEIADFGLGRTLKPCVKPNQALTRLGTPLFASPQIFTDETYTSKVDMYSFGVIIYRLIYGKYPIHMRNISLQREAVLNIKNDPIKCPLIKGRNENMIQLTEMMLKYEEKDRPLWTQIFSTKGLKKPCSLSIIEQ